MEETELCFPQMPNRSCRMTRRDSGQYLSTSLVFSILSTLIVSLNLLVILSITCFRQVQSSTHRILLSLAVSDFLMGLVLIPVSTHTVGVCWVWGDVLCVLCFFIATILFVASMSSMVLIAVDRYIAVMNPMHYHRHMSICRVNLAICLTWTYAFLYCFINTSDFNNLSKHAHCLGECRVSFLAEMDIVFSWAFPFSIILILYIRIFRVVIIKSKAAGSNASTSQVIRRSEVKAARNLGTVIVAYVICYFPFYCTAYSKDMLQNIQNDALGVTALLLFMNSAVNPIIYVLIYPNIRKAFRTILTLEILRSRSIVL